MIFETTSIPLTFDAFCWSFLIDTTFTENQFRTYKTSKSLFKTFQLYSYNKSLLCHIFEFTMIILFLVQLMPSIPPPWYH